MPDHNRFENLIKRGYLNWFQTEKKNTMMLALCLMIQHLILFPTKLISIGQVVR